MKYRSIIAGFALFLSAPAFAQEAPTPAEPVTQPEPAPKQEIKIRQLSSIDFGLFAAESNGGTITVLPSGARVPGGNVSLINSKSYGPAEFEITGAPEEMVTVYLPETVTLNRDEGHSTVTITNLTLGTEPTIKLDAQGYARIKVGGTLQLPGNIAIGGYNGIFDLDVRYLRP